MLKFQEDEKLVCIHLNNLHVYLFACFHSCSTFYVENDLFMA